MSTTCSVGDSLCHETLQFHHETSVILRHDKSTYLNARRLPKIDGLFEESSESRDDAWDHTLLDPLENIERIGPSILQSECRLFLAESSIPNGGMGIFAGVEINEFEQIEQSYELGIPLIDITEIVPEYFQTTISTYPWKSFLFNAHLDADDVHVISPGIGMLGNCHLGLINTHLVMKAFGLAVQPIAINSMRRDAGTGAVAPFFGMNFYSKESAIGRGSELFSDYGIEYFHNREKDYGLIFPTPDDYIQADIIVRDFVSNNNDITEEIRQKWQLIISEQKSDVKKFRIGHALAFSADALHLVADIGTARYSLPDSIRSDQWLAENGSCASNLRIGSSIIPQAGKGAFAVRYVQKGAIIGSAPLLQLDRKILNDNRTGRMTQLLLNYCFSHANSSILFIPYTPAVQAINHDGKKPNAKIQWSTMKLNKVDWLKENLDEIKSKKVAGLIIDFVATKNILVGEEVTIDYGSAWADAWNKHSEGWGVSDKLYEEDLNDELEALNKDLTQPIRTLSEQEKNPYNLCIRTACKAGAMNGTFTMEKLESTAFLRGCSIVGREWKDDQYWYSARMEGVKGLDAAVFYKDLVLDIPRWAILFVEQKYCSDIHKRGVFRKEISFPEGMFPLHWID